MSRFKSMSVGTDGEAIVLSIFKEEPDTVIPAQSYVQERDIFHNTTHLTRTEALQLATRLLRLLDDNSTSCWVSPEEKVPA